MFNPDTEYDIIPKSFSIKDFYDYPEDFVVRPPYQRKNVWGSKKQQDLLDSLFRQYYIPRIVLREVRLTEKKSKYEVVDGQQRINTVYRFFNNELKIPDTLEDVLGEYTRSKYEELPAEIRRFIDRELTFDADIVKNIEDPKNATHQKIATEIFWRLQQGESLNYMEIAHSRLSSLVRNFVVKYSDDITFNYDDYIPVDNNTDKHPFFKIINRNNDRMQHLALLTRMLMLEGRNGATDIQDKNVMAFIDESQHPDGIGDYSYEKEDVARKTLTILNTFNDVFSEDPMIIEKGVVRELRVEYFILSFYLLLSHLSKYYVMDEKEKEIFREFLIHFYQRWSDKNEEDRDLIIFSDNRQQSGAEIETRDRVLRQLFFEYLNEKGYEFLTKDERRSFNEAERIKIYRRFNGICQMCKEEGLPERECRVPWKEYEADHVLPHSKGGLTSLENAQLLCRRHNRMKSDELFE